MAKDDLALYIHIHFCKKRCSYCDFCSTAEGKDREAYLDVLITQISSAPWREDLPQSRELSSIYFGGGTPSLLGTDLVLILEAIRRAFVLSDDCEITLEANPESFSAGLAADLAQAGFTRVSLGLQALDEQQLALLGRIHSVEDALSALHAARDAELRVSADLILGLPLPATPLLKQPLLNELLSLVGHLSIYPLTIEEGTELERMFEAGEIELPSEDEVAQEITNLEQMLSQQGFSRYEISSYARPGQESRQNTRYWQGGDYLGFGLSAASMLNHADGSRKRFVMYQDMDQFLQASCTSLDDATEVDLLSAAEARREDIMLALRTRRGVDSEDVEQAGLGAIAGELVEKNLLELDSGRYRCTQEGWLLANIVFAAVWMGNT